MHKYLFSVPDNIIRELCIFSLNTVPLHCASFFLLHFAEIFVLIRLPVVTQVVNPGVVSLNPSSANILSVVRQKSL